MRLHQRSNMEASIGTLIFMLLLLLLLLFVYIGAPKVEEDEGIEVAFGNADEGGGYQPDPTQEAASMPSAAPAPQVSQPSNNDLMTQEDEETLALQRQREKDAKKKAEAEQERIRRQKEAEAQAEAERIAQEQALAQQKAQQQAAIDKANAMGSLFGNNSSGSGSGDSQGDGHKGNPVGHGSKGGVSWSLDGRGIKALPEPDKTFEQAGKVVVNIQVDGEGNVISASVGSGTTVSDYKTQQLAIAAAKKAKFSKSENKIQMGTISYTFKFN